MSGGTKKIKHSFAPPTLLEPGDRVRLWKEMSGVMEGGKLVGRIGKGRSEYGIVVSVKKLKNNGPTYPVQDCRVAFVGFDKGNFKRGTMPYLLRYYNTSPEKLP